SVGEEHPLPAFRARTLYGIVPPEGKSLPKAIRVGTPRDTPGLALVNRPPPMEEQPLQSLHEVPIPLKQEVLYGLAYAFPESGASAHPDGLCGQDQVVPL